MSIVTKQAPPQAKSKKEENVFLECNGDGSSRFTYQNVKIRFSSNYF
jgi:hypothetical protein